MTPAATGAFVVRAQRWARAKGKHCGRPMQEMSEDQLQTARKLQEEGMGVRRISAVLGMKRSTLHRHLSQKPPAEETP